METLYKVCLVLTIIGFFDFNLVDTIFGVGSILSRLVYIVVGICGLIDIGILLSHIETK